MASTRLPNKPLEVIGDKPMIVHVAVSAKASRVGEVVVACDGEQIASEVKKAGFRFEITDPHLPSGSDRIYWALQAIDPQEAYDVIINVQGDMPTLDPSLIGKVASLLQRPEVDIGTLAAKITDPAEIDDPSVVKAVFTPPSGKALSFSRKAVKSSDGFYYHHIGIYAYRRAALQRFVNLPPSILEQQEKLEQLRALEAGFHIEVAAVDTVPLGVDTPETLEKARKLL
jgi:3-deoxy-manno-octulosonate cytidylyltransferase (CMP-KDO synthetase)